MTKVKLKPGDLIKYGRQMACKVVEVRNDSVVVQPPPAAEGVGIEVQKLEDIPLTDIILIVMEVIGLFNRIWEVRIPLKIQVGDVVYALHLHYDTFDNMVFIGYKSPKGKTLIGTTYGKSIRSAKKAIKSKLEQAGYL